MNKKSNYFATVMILCILFYTYYKLFLYRMNIDGIASYTSANIVSKTMAVS